MSAIIQGKQMQSDKAVPLAPLSRAAETAPTQHCLLVTWTKNGQQYPIFQAEENIDLGLGIDLECCLIPDS